MIKELVWVGISLLQPAAQPDSIGVETVNGKIFVIHKVSEKETLYAISRRYGTTVDAIVQYNPTAKTSLDVGQILKVPYTAPAGAKKTTPAPATSGGGGIIHVVTAGETIFSIAKAYSVSAEDIKQWNNLGDNAISVGRELVIKRRGTASTTTTPVTTPPPATPAPVSRKGTHTVAPKETMFSIARQYNISVDQLKQWNNLTTPDLSVGQVLMVASPERSTQVSTPTRQENPPAVVKTTPAPVTRTPEPQHTTPSPATTPPASTTPVTTKETATQTIRISESTRNSDEVLESGMAELIEGTEGNRKYLALHRTAPVGTILKIKNEMNNREVFVRVMGKLPEGAMADSKVVIRISKSAYDRLGAIDPKFRVQVTYYK
jgi:LysM repeat protein